MRDKISSIGNKISSIGNKISSIGNNREIREDLNINEVDVSKQRTFERHLRTMRDI